VIIHVYKLSVLKFKYTITFKFHYYYLAQNLLKTGSPSRLATSRKQVFDESQTSLMFTTCQTSGSRQILDKLDVVEFGDNQ